MFVTNSENKIIAFKITLENFIFCWKSKIRILDIIYLGKINTWSHELHHSFVSLKKDKFTTDQKQENI